MKKRISPDCEIDIDVKEKGNNSKVKIKLKGEGCAKLTEGLSQGGFSLDKLNLGDLD